MTVRRPPLAFALAAGVLALLMTATPALCNDAGKSPDLPGASPAEDAEPLTESPDSDQPAACLEIVGPWAWFTGDVKYFHADGTMDNGADQWSGTWTCTQTDTLNYVLDWNHGTYVDRLTMNSDGNRLSGGNQYGVEVWGERLAE